MIVSNSDIDPPAIKIVYNLWNTLSSLYEEKSTFSNIIYPMFYCFSLKVRQIDKKNRCPID